MLQFCFGRGPSLKCPLSQSIDIRRARSSYSVGRCPARVAQCAGGAPSEPQDVRIPETPSLAAACLRKRLCTMLKSSSQGWAPPPPTEIFILDRTLLYMVKCFSQKLQSPMPVQVHVSEEAHDGCHLDSCLGIL